MLGEDNALIERNGPEESPWRGERLCCPESWEAQLCPALCTSQNKLIREIAFMVAFARVSLSVLQCPVP